MSWAAVLLAVALLAAPGPSEAAQRAGRPRPVVRARQRSDVDDPLATASCLDVFAVCLTSGMAVATAAAAASVTAPKRLAQLFVRAADLLSLGAEPSVAWADHDDADPYSRTVGRLARRSASSGAALAQAVAELADQCRHDCAATADAAAERASVLIAGPLGVCYLPAFVCLGLVPVIVGLAGDVFATTVL